MAEVGIAASIIGIASTGIAVVSALTKFSISIRGANEKINFLAGRVSLTVSILEDIAATVRIHASGFKEREFWKTWGSVLDACEESYERIDKAVAKARGKNAGRAGDEKKVSVWGKLVWALGGESEMKDLETTLETCCQQVMMMQQAVQLTVLSLLHQLTSDEAAERRELMGKLEWLLTGLSANGNLVLPGRNPKDRPAVVIRNDHPQQIPPIEVYSGSRVPPPDSPSRPKGGLFGPETGRPTAQHLGLSSLFVIPPRRKSPSSPRQEPVSPLPEDSNGRRPVFEAFYILPRSLPRHQEKGEVQVAKASSDDYMIICVDARGDYYKDKNVRDAIRRSKRGDAPPTADEFPRAVRETTTWLKDHRSRHNSDITWSLVYGIELQYLDEFFFRRTSSKSGFLIVLCGVRTVDSAEEVEGQRASSYSRSPSRSRPNRTALVEVSTSDGRSRSSRRKYPVIISDRTYEDYTYDSDSTKLGELPKPHSKSRSRSRSSAGDKERLKTELQLRKMREEREQRLKSEYDDADRRRRERLQRRERRTSHSGMVEYGTRPVIVDHLSPGFHRVSLSVGSPASSDSLDDLHHDESKDSRTLEANRRERLLNASRLHASGIHVGAAVAAGTGSTRRARSEGVEVSRKSLPPRREERMAVSDDESDITHFTRSATLVNEGISRSLTAETETEVHVSQQEAETMVMNFLATFADVKRDSF